MGVTGAIFKSLTFDGESSRDYGVYISGSGVYNSPERDVEMITIPYRNGAFVQDNGRFNNIEITYPAGVYADTEEDFAEAVSNFRNFLSSKVGYCRLEDEYNPDEYRLAVYKSGLEVTPKMLKAGEFNIVFECKPQRFLKSGEVRTEKTSSSFTLTNPTPFESKPLLELYGTGSAVVDGSTITSTPTTLGKVALNLAATADPKLVQISNSYLYNLGDEMHLTRDLDVYGYNFKAKLDYGAGVSCTATLVSGQNFRVNPQSSNGIVRIDFDIYNWDFTSESTKSRTHTYRVRVTAGGNTETLSGSVTIYYRDSDKSFRISNTTLTTSATVTYTYDLSNWRASVDSTVTNGGNPTYVDLETGDAYATIGGQQVLVNDSVQLPAKLPVLNPGSNTITKTGLTKVAITPRWWKI